MKICLLHCKKLFISLERNIFHVTWALLLKLHLVTFSHWERMFLSICGLSILIICLVALNTELVFLEALKKWFCALSSKMTFSAKSSNSWNLSSALQKTVHFIRKKHFSCYLSFALKIAFSNFFSLRKMFLSICGLSILIICLVALNTELVFLEALKKWFCAFKL